MTYFTPSRYSAAPIRDVQTPTRSNCKTERAVLPRQSAPVVSPDYRHPSEYAVDKYNHPPGYYRNTYSSSSLATSTPPSPSRPSQYAPEWNGYYHSNRSQVRQYRAGHPSQQDVRFDGRHLSQDTRERGYYSYPTAYGRRQSQAYGRDCRYETVESSRPHYRHHQASSPSPIPFPSYSRYSDRDSRLVDLTTDSKENNTEYDGGVGSGSYPSNENCSPACFNQARPKTPVRSVRPAGTNDDTSYDQPTLSCFSEEADPSADQTAFSPTTCFDHPQLLDVDSLDDFKIVYDDLVSIGKNTEDGDIIGVDADSQQAAPENPNELRPTDIVCGRGAPTNYHPGNDWFRELVREHQTQYLCAKRSDKPVIATKLLNLLKSEGRRFVRRIKSHKGQWEEIDEKRAFERVCQSLRDGAPELRRQLLASTKAKEAKKSIAEKRQRDCYSPLPCW